MIGLDTNVLVRYVAQDEPEQSARATELIEGLDEDDPGFVSTVALVELHWVLRRAYQTTRAEAAAIVRGLLDSREILVQDADVVRRALAQVSGDVDFPDAVISEAGGAAGCAHTVTFDHQASRLRGMTLVPDSGR